ncbi:MAG: Cna B-type domain-containing protein [Clostridiales bacterium]|nr:Cna B-type domain-containing protein [Clostridiales bacterium]
MTRLCALLCLLLCLSMLPGMACAQVEPEREGSLTLSLTEADKGLAGVEFSVYRVASVNEGAQFDLLDGLDAGSLDVNRLENAEDWAALADALAGQVASPDGTAVTDAAGNAKLSGLRTGLYLVVGKKTEIDGWTYAFAPFMASVPTRNGDAWQYDAHAEVKYQRTPVICDVQVLKLWEDEGYTKERPDSILVDLYCDGARVQTIELSADNNWSWVFTGLESAHEWSVKEQRVPEGYKVEYSQEGDTLVITNTLTGKPDAEPDIPQTGLTWWPVPVLAIAGAVLFMIGWAMRRKERSEHEQA